MRKEEFTENLKRIEEIIKQKFSKHVPGHTLVGASIIGKDVPMTPVFGNLKAKGLSEKEVMDPVMSMSILLYYQKNEH